MKRIALTFRIHRAVIAGLLLAGLSACRKEAPPPPPPLPVNTVSAAEREVEESDEFTGRMVAVDSVEIRPRVSGYIDEIKFKEGADVKKGDLLLVIDPRPYQAELERATGQLEQAQAQLKLAEIDLKRAKELRDAKVTSPQEFDQKAATSQQAAGAVRAADAAKSAAALNLEFTQIRSPINGRMSNARVTVGNLVQPGAGAESVLTTVVSVDPIYVYFDVDENAALKRIRLIGAGKSDNARTTRIPVLIGLGDEPDFPHTGYIDFVDNRLEPGTGTIRLRAVVKVWDPLLTPGYFVRVKVGGGQRYRAALIDDKVISSQQGLKFAFVVKADNTLERRTLETGTLFEGKRIVKSGLKAGDRVVSTRLQLLQPGMTVTPIEEKPEPAPQPPAKS